ncbi:MAG: sigma-70 family RNA polymerase sigma factor [Cyclobacteriaceae bacterium]
MDDSRDIRISKNVVVPFQVNELSLEQVYSRYFDKLYSYAKVICRSQSMAKDVVSDLFYSLLKSKTNLGEIRNLEVYLMVSVKNRATSAVAKVLSEKEIKMKQQTVDNINPEEVLLEKELKELLDKSVAELPDKSQLVFRMAREKGMKYKEIAKELGITEMTVKSQLKRAQEKLKNDILKFYDNPKRDLPADMRIIGSFLLIGSISIGKFSIESIFI